MSLTIGMAACNDNTGVFYTVQALKLYQDLTDTEILVVDNVGDHELGEWLDYWGTGRVRHVVYTDKSGTSAPRDRVFRESRTDWTICIDSHVFLMPDAVAQLRHWCSVNPTFMGLIQGPMVYDDGMTCSTHWDPVWRDNMLGTWSKAVPYMSLNGPVEIVMQGLGLFGCRTDAWLGFNPQFEGFGGEEGYIHFKYARLGRKVLCLPFMGWMHKTWTGSKPPYSLNLLDRVRNYVIGFSELGLSIEPIKKHFGIQIVRKAQQMVKPKISCWCATYGRRELLNEAVESFLRQDYDGEKELVILNDDPDVRYEFDHPEIVVINSPTRYDNLGQKFNALIDKCTGEYITPWADDDIRLPHTLTLLYNAVNGRRHASVNRYIYSVGLNDPKMHMMRGEVYGASITAKSLWSEVGGFPETNSGEDQGFMKKIHKRGEFHLHRMRDDEVYFMYRWGTKSYHVSAFGTGKGWNEAKRQVDKTEKGTFRIEPKWNMDYVQLTQSFIQRLESGSSS